MIQEALPLGLHMSSEVVQCLPSCEISSGCKIASSLWGLELRLNLSLVSALFNP